MLQVFNRNAKQDLFTLFDCQDIINVKRERQIHSNLHQTTRFFINMYETEHSLKELPKGVIGISKPRLLRKQLNVSYNNNKYASRN